MTNPYSIRSATYEQFKEQWLSDVLAGSPSPLDKGRRFGAKIIRDWLDVSHLDVSPDDLIILDGSGDGGLDIAYLERAEADEGDTWYIIQSKYGTAFRGYDTIITEGNKVLDTLTGRNTALSSDSRDLRDKINVFCNQASEADRLVLVFATEDPISESDRGALREIRNSGAERLVGEASFLVEEVSLKTVYEMLGDLEPERLTVPMKGTFIRDEDFLLGVVPLTDLFAFLTEYRSKTGNLDQIYDKNVRKYLGPKRINKGIADTLRDNPEKFGLYNNGITIVASSRDMSDDMATVTLTDPYIVNGCQTTRTVWQVLDGKLNTGGTGDASDVEAWKARASRGGVVTKIVHEEADRINITRYTNSQNAVRPQDFITLEDGFQSWAKDMENCYGIFLEIQRGGIDARKSYEKQHPEEQKFKDYVYAFDLLKVYGAGWIGKPGTAFGKNAPFLPPDGTLYKDMTQGDGDVSFDVHDLYAAYAIKREADADEVGFGRMAKQPSRRQSRFLFYFVIIDMLKSIISSTPDLIGNQPMSRGIVTDSVLRLAAAETGQGKKLLSSAAVGVIDSYLTQGGGLSAHNEESFTRDHNGDLNGFLKADNLGTEQHSPLLVRLLESSKLAFSMAIPGADKTRREIVAQEILSTPPPPYDDE